jgi:hypothetical protein
MSRVSSAHFYITRFGRNSNFPSPTYPNVRQNVCAHCFVFICNGVSGALAAGLAEVS